MTTKCSKCNADNPDTKLFCGDCGNRLISSDEDSFSRTKTFKPDKPQMDLKQIGNYKILEVIGKGGMGTVYLAQQEKPIKRKIAIKVIIPGMDTKEVIARFESEQQAHAMMNHPNIAQVHDSGVTEQGHPYFVMEYVPGKPITEYCDKYKMTTKERLGLFLTVCEAVQHAHYRGIVHRDIKPTNVLVTLQDNRHVPKIIDFGLAKALSGVGLTEKTLHTQYGIGVGTPIYMSPEQAELTGYDIDTRTDVYSLGVLLYELLVGVTPFDEEELERAGILEILRIIREEDPLRPSTKFISLRDSSNEIARMRKTTKTGMAKLLSGDLDLVIMKALEKDRIRRYGSAAELASDINHYLSNEAITARPPSIIYKAKKTIKRHKTLSFSFTAIFLCIIIFSFWNTVERRNAEKFAKESSYNFAISLKERAKTCVQENKWQLVKLYAANSLVYQEKANKYFSITDIELPYLNQDWILKHSIFKPLTLVDSSQFVEKGMFPVGIFGIGRNFSSDGKYYASRESNNPEIIYLWEISNGKEIARIKDQTSRFSELFISPEGKYLASAGGGLIRIWEISTGEEIVNKKIFGKSIINGSLVFSSDNKYFACKEVRSVRDFDRIIVCELPSGREILKLERLALSSYGLMFSPDSRYIASGTYDHTIKIWSVPGGQEIYTLGENISEKEVVEYRRPYFSLKFSTDGKYLASQCENESIKVWELENKRELLNIKDYRGSASEFFPLRLCFSPDSKHLASGGYNKEIKIWNLERNEEETVLIGHNAPVVFLQYSSDGKSLISGGINRISLWELNNRKTTTILSKHTDRISSLNMSLDGKHLVSGSWDRTIRIWEIPNGKEIDVISGYKKRVSEACISPDGRYLASVEEYGEKIDIWDLNKGQIVNTVNELVPGIFSLGYSPDGKYLVYSGHGGKIILRDSSNNELIRILRLGSGTVTSAAFSPDGQYLAALSFNELRIWEIPSGKKVITITAETKPVEPGFITSFCFSSDNKCLVYVKDNVINFWDIQSEEIIFSLEGHEAQINSILFSPNGKYLALSGSNSEVVIWDIAKGKEVTTLRGHGGPVSSLCFSPDGKYLITGGQDKKIIIWDFEYITKYLWNALSYPYKEKDLARILREIEKHTGFRLEGLTPVSSVVYEELEIR